MYSSTAQRGLRLFRAWIRARRPDRRAVMRGSRVAHVVSASVLSGQRQWDDLPPQATVGEGIMRWLVSRESPPQNMESGGAVCARLLSAAIVTAWVARQVSLQGSDDERSTGAQASANITARRVTALTARSLPGSRAVSAA